MNSLYIALILASALCVYGQQQCKYDYQCGNLPYSQCKGGVNDCTYTVSGLAIDRSAGEIYYAQVCRRTDYSEFYATTNTTFKKVSAIGGVPSIVRSQTNPYKQPSPSVIYEVYGSKLYYRTYLLLTLDTQQPDAAEQSASLLTPQGTYEHFTDGLDFDRSKGESYACVSTSEKWGVRYQVYKYTGVIGQGSSKREVLYSLNTSSCNVVRAQENSDNIFFVTLSYSSTGIITSSFWRGSKSCNNCTNHQLLFSVGNESVADFVVVNNRFYYASNKGVYSSDIYGQQQTQLSPAAATGIEYFNGKLFFNNREAIISMNLDGTNTKQVNADTGKCGCSYGFTGQDCQTCDGQIQWYLGQPACVSIGADGYPERCHYDYECGNQPWTACYNTCQCRYGFSGSQCNQCTNSSLSIVWRNGYPFCE